MQKKPDLIFRLSLFERVMKIIFSSLISSPRKTGRIVTNNLTYKSLACILPQAFKAGRSKSSTVNPSSAYFSTSLVPAFFMQASIWLSMFDPLIACSSVYCYHPGSPSYKVLLNNDSNRSCICQLAVPR